MRFTGVVVVARATLPLDGSPPRKSRKPSHASKSATTATRHASSTARSRSQRVILRSCYAARSSTTSMQATRAGPARYASMPGAYRARPEAD